MLCMDRFSMVLLFQVLSNLWLMSCSPCNPQKKHRVIGTKTACQTWECPKTQNTSKKQLWPRSVWQPKQVDQPVDSIWCGCHHFYDMFSFSMFDGRIWKVFHKLSTISANQCALSAVGCVSFWKLPSKRGGGTSRSHKTTVKQKYMW